MADFGSVISGVIPSGSNTIIIATIIIAVIFGFLLVVGLLTWWYFKKRWNLKVEIKLVRTDGKLVDAEWGKGYFNVKRGVVMIKRAGIRSRPIPMKVFDVRKYIQGSDILTVMQIGPDDYRPVLNTSWLEHNAKYEVIDEDTGRPTGEIEVIKESVLNIEIESQEDKAWKTAWDAAAKKAYSISTFFQQFQTPIAIGIVVICCFVGFAILWARIGV